MKQLREHIYQLNSLPIWCGCMPVDTDQEMSYRNLSYLYELGVRRIINLTEAIESGPNTVLGQNYLDSLEALKKEECAIDLHLMPIKDYGVPTLDFMREILGLIEQEDGGLYIHCMGGAGRTGTVVGCYLREVYEVSAEQALESLREHIALTKIHRSPETAEQIAMINNWK